MSNEGLGLRVLCSRYREVDRNDWRGPGFLIRKQEGRLRYPNLPANDWVDSDEDQWQENFNEYGEVTH